MLRKSGKHQRGGGNQLSLEDGQTDDKQRLRETKVITSIKENVEVGACAQHAGNEVDQTD